MRKVAALLLAAGAIYVADAEPRGPEPAAPKFISGLPLPLAAAVLELDGFASGPVPWAHGADPAFGWVRTRGTQLVVGDGDAATPWYHVGSNLWHGMHLGAASGPGSDRPRLLRDLDALARAGVTHVRVLGASEGPDTEPWRVTPSLQPCPGTYNAAVLDGFDYLLYQLGKRRMRATVVLGNEWPWSGGAAQYVRWAQHNTSCDLAGGPGRTPSLANATWRARGFESLPYPGPGTASWADWQHVAGQFYTSEAAQSLWRRHVTFMLSRTNRYTGISVAEDPTVIILELANEPRPKGGAPMWRADLSPFRAWLADTAAFVKELAPNQLIASGQEGDTQRNSLGQSMLLNQNSSNIDVITLHVWPMNFQWLDPSSSDSIEYALSATRAYITASVAQAAELRRPLIIEEFGWPRDAGSISVAAPTKARDTMYTLVFNAVIASAESAGALAGASFWGYAGTGRPSFGYEAVPATAAELCTPSAPPQRNFAGTKADWAACFADEGARPEACPYWTWWSPAAAAANASFRGQTTLLHDPPHETQGWYSTYDTDASTMAVVVQASRRLQQLHSCTASAVQTARAAERSDGIATLARYGAAACVSALGPPPDAGTQPPRARLCAAGVAAAEPQDEAHFWARLPTTAQAPAPAPAFDAAEDVHRFAPPVKSRS